MKIQIDIEAKTIAVEENVKFSDLIKNLNKLFPKGEWKKDYTLKTGVKAIEYWWNPIPINYWIVQPYVYPTPYDYNRWPITVCGQSTTNIQTVNTFTYNSQNTTISYMNLDPNDSNSLSYMNLDPNDSNSLSYTNQGTSNNLNISQENIREGIYCVEC